MFGVMISLTTIHLYGQSKAALRINVSDSKKKHIDSYAYNAEFDSLSSLRFILNIFDTNNVNDRRKIYNDLTNDYDTIIKVKNIYGISYFYSSRNQNKFLLAYYEINPIAIHKYNISKYLSASFKRRFFKGYQEFLIYSEPGNRSLSIYFKILNGSLISVKFLQTEFLCTFW